MKKRVTLYVDSDVYDNYKKYCDSNAMVISKRIEYLVVEDLEKIKKEGEKYGKQ